MIQMEPGIIKGFSKKFFKMKRIFFTGFGVLVMAFQVFGQTKPYITNIDKTSAAAGDKVVISGINFPALADAKVHFGAGVGTVTAATSDRIEVTVPGSATFGSVSVTNLTNGLTAYSSENFMLSYGGTTFDPASLETAAKFPSGQNGMYDLCTCDFDGDGKLDVASSQDGSNVTMVPVFQNNSDIDNLAFPTITDASLTINESSFTVTCGDLDGDGKPELLATRAQAAGGTPGDIIFVFKNSSTTGVFSFENPTSLTLPTDAAGNRKNVAKIAIADVDGDGKPDVVATNEVDNQIDIFKNSSTAGTISFATQSTQFSIGGNSTFGLDVKDLNNDGFPEIIASTLTTANMYVLPNTSSPGTIAFGASQTLTVAGELVNIAVGDLNNDGLSDIAVTQVLRNQVTILVNQTAAVGGSISFATGQSFAVSSTPWGLDLGDANGDGLLDILVASTASNNMTLLENLTSGSLAFDSHNIPAAEPTRNARIADVNADGKPDLLAAGITNSNLVVFANKNCITPVLTPANPQVCEGSDFRIEATKSVGHTYTWETGPDAGSLTQVKTGAESFLDLTALAAGTLLVQVTVVSDETTAACTASATTQLTVSGTPPTPPTIADPPAVCQGTTLDIDGTLPTPADAKSYQWTGPNGFSSTDAILSIPDIDASKAGVYSLRYVSQSDCLSPAIDVTVTVQSLPAVNVRYTGNGLFCEDAPVTLTTPSYSGYDYQWFRDGTAVSGATTTSLSATASGQYAVQITDQGTACSELTPAQTLTRTLLPNTTFTAADAICVDVPLALDATSTVGAGATGVTLAYAWDYQDDGTTDNTTVSTTNTYTTAGTVTVSLTTGYNEISGCTSVLTKDIEVRAVPVVPIETPDGIEKCPETSVTLQVPAGYISYAWSTSETTNSIVVPDPGTYTVTIVDDAQCTIVSSVDITNFDTSSSVTVTSNDAVIDEDATTQFTVSGHTAIISWDPMTGISDSDATSPNPVVTGIYTSEDYANLDTNGQLVYTYTVTALDGNGCQVTASVDLAVIPEETPVPMKSFSPNGDGIGDFWEIDNAEFNQECKLVIYDRRGRAIVEKRPYNNDWDGTLNGNALEQGVYYYVFICDDPTRNSNGSILLFR